ncbi:Uncharacterized protein Rs2_07508 [Raphanus sativus]|uniref:Uncharacterized protein LOC108819930 n=1 Tax=Raphanus sativus TaxID=3726 RepID=A0A6J0KLH0_RAPSA|nr:uncharacterized protein LOC108819930 [Raphanus sativus]KAJ4912887.1 Uncharacterized protein Rs2_07508 [Raphanus sativus]
MASSYLSITQTVSSKLCAGINSCSDYNRSHVLTPSRKGYVNQSLRLHSNQKSLKHLTRARKLEDEDEKEKDEEKVHYAGEDDDTEDYPVEEEDKDECRAEEAVLKLYTDIKDRNINGISEVIGDECQCFCNLLSSYRLLQGKKQVMAFFYWLMMNLGKDIKIIVRPTSKDGMTVGVQWQLEWEKSNIQLGKGVSFHICHIYQGKLLIKNVEMFMEPIFHVEPLRLRSMAFAVSLAEKMVTFLRPVENIRRQAMTVLLLALLLLAAVAFYFTQPRQ